MTNFLDAPDQLLHHGHGSRAVDDQCSLPLPLVLRTTCHSISIGCPDPAIRFSVGFHGRGWNGRCRDQRSWIHSVARGGGGLGDGGDRQELAALGSRRTAMTQKPKPRPPKPPAPPPPEARHFPPRLRALAPRAHYPAARRQGHRGQPAPAPGFGPWPSSSMIVASRPPRAARGARCKSCACANGLVSEIDHDPPGAERLRNFQKSARDPHPCHRADIDARGDVAQPARRRVAGLGCFS